MDAEISFQDMILRTWARRGFLGILMLVSGLAVVAWSLVSAGFTAGDIVFYIDLKGIEKGAYPGGAAFSPNDLQSPEVLRAAVDAAGLEAELLETIRSGLLIEHGSPETYGIIKKYRQRLSANNLSAVEIDAQNEAFKDELEQAAGSSLRLIFNPSRAQLTNGSAFRLLQEIPAQWTRVYSERYRIYAPPGLERAAVTGESDFLRQPAEVIAATSTVNTIQEGLRTIATDNRVRHLVNSSGHSAPELLEMVRVFRSTQFGPLSLAVLDKPDPVTDSYRADLRLRIQFLNAQIDGYDRISELLFYGREGGSTEWAAGSDASTVNQLQLSGDSLVTIMELTERAASAEFLHEVMLDRNDLARERAEVTVELARSEIPSRYEVGDDLVTAAEEGLASLIDNYSDLYGLALQKLQTELGTLYSVSTAPMQSRELQLDRVLMRGFGLLLSVLMVGILIVFIAPDPRARQD